MFEKKEAPNFGAFFVLILLRRLYANIRIFALNCYIGRVIISNMNKFFTRLLASLLDMQLSKLRPEKSGVRLFLSIFIRNIREVVEILTDNDHENNKQLAEIFERARPEIAHAALIFTEEEINAKVSEPEKRAVLLAAVELLRNEMSVG